MSPLLLNNASADERWDDQFGNPGVQGYSVSAIAIVQNEVYIGGTFLFVGGVETTNIAKWNGKYWTEVGSGLGTGLNHGVGSLEFCGGVIYSGGLFTNAGAVPALNVAGWDGTNWHPLGSGIPGVVKAIASEGTNIYFGGSFTIAGGMAATNVARWDGQQWWSLGNGVKGEENGIGTVDAIGVGLDGIYVGGSFTNASGVSATNVARWDGSNWHALGKGVPKRVRSLAVIGTNVYAGSGPFPEDGTNAVYLREWNGMEWRSIGFTSWPAAGAVQALAVCGGDLYVGGVPRVGGIQAFGLAKWDGSSWSALGSGLSQGGPGALACTGSELFVGGQFTGAGGNPSTNIALWHIPHSLSISQAGDQVEVRWPVTGTNFLLESKNDLNGLGWVEVLSPPDVHNEECVVTEPMNGTNRFYRLRRKPWE